jgi:hypothetical protein
MPNEYEINEKDIEAVLRFLKATDPEHATSEIAVALLEHMQAAFHKMAVEDPDMLQKMYEELKTEKGIS